MLPDRLRLPPAVVVAVTLVREVAEPVVIATAPIVPPVMATALAACVAMVSRPRFVRAPAAVPAPVPPSVRGKSVVRVKEGIKVAAPSSNVSEVVDLIRFTVPEPAKSKDWNHPVLVARIERSVRAAPLPAVSRSWLCSERVVNVLAMTASQFVVSLLGYWKFSPPEVVENPAI